MTTIACVFGSPQAQGALRKFFPAKPKAEGPAPGSRGAAGGRCGRAMPHGRAGRVRAAPAPCALAPALCAEHRRPPSDQAPAGAGDAPPSAAYVDDAPFENGHAPLAEAFAAHKVLPARRHGAAHLAWFNLVCRAETGADLRTRT